jgi:RNA polymerase sigma factor (sigma-70 family)
MTTMTIDQPTQRLTMAQCLERNFEYIQMIVATRMTRQLLNRFTVDDVVHEVIVEVMQNGSQFEYRGNTSFLGWISTVARRVISDLRRREFRHPQTVGISSDDSVNMLQPSRIPSPMNTPSTFARSNEERRVVCNALASLSPSDRIVIRLIMF